MMSPENRFTLFGIMFQRPLPRVQAPLSTSPLKTLSTRATGKFSPSDEARARARADVLHLRKIHWRTIRQPGPSNGRYLE